MFSFIILPASNWTQNLKTLVIKNRKASYGYKKITQVETLSNQI